MMHSLQAEPDDVMGRKNAEISDRISAGNSYAFIYPVIRMTRISEERKAVSIDLEAEDPQTSLDHMFEWSTISFSLMGSAIAIHRFFRTINPVERELNQRVPERRNE